MKDKNKLFSNLSPGTYKVTYKSGRSEKVRIFTAKTAVSYLKKEGKIKSFAKTSKRYKIYEEGPRRTYESEGTLEELIKYHKYTLETGKSYEHEKGNKKINMNPKTIDSLVNNLYNAKNNAAADGYSGYNYDYEELD